MKWELSISITNSVIKGSWWPTVNKFKQKWVVKWRFGYVSFDWWT